MQSVEVKFQHIVFPTFTGRFENIQEQRLNRGNKYIFKSS